MTDITGADQTRGSEFGKVMKSPLFWGLVLFASVCAGAAAGLYWNPAAGAAGFVAVLVLGFICGLAYAKAMAAQSFYDTYAKARGLTRSQDQLGQLTPLMAGGAGQRTDELFSGSLGDGFSGSLALFTITDRHLDNQRDATRKDNPYTLVHIELGETTARLPELAVHRRSGSEALDTLEDAFRRDHDRVTLESEALEGRLEIFVPKGEDPGYVRQVFSPSFIVWLSDSSPADFAFELAGGNLVAYVPGYRDDTEGFDEMLAAGSTVAKRLKEEAAE